MLNINGEFNSKKNKGKNNIIKNRDSSLFKQKNKFFYDNAINIIESSDELNKLNFLDVLCNLSNTKIQNEKQYGLTERSLNSIKDKKIAKLNLKNLPIKIEENEKKCKENTQKLDNEDEQFFKVKSYSNSTHISPNSSFMKQQQYFIFPQNFTCDKFNVTSNNQNTIFNKTSLSSSRHQKNILKINSAITTFTKFNEKLEKDLDTINQIPKYKNNTTQIILPEYFKQFNNDFTFLHKMYFTKEVRNKLEKMQSERYGKQTLNNKIKRIKHQLEKRELLVDNKKKFDQYFKNKYKNINFSENNNYKLIGEKTKILKVPMKFKVESIANTSSLKTARSMPNILQNVQDIYAIKSTKNLKKEVYYENLSIRPEKYRNSFLASIRKNLETVEKGNISIKNKIIQIRQNLNNSSKYINPKFLVVLPSDKTI